MNNIQHHRVKKENDCYLHVQVRYPKGHLNNCNIIFVHGFLGDGVENHRMFINIASALNEKGYTCVLYDQTGCGYSDGHYNLVRLLTLKDDLKIITKWVSKNLKGGIAYIGQSLGSALILNNNCINQNICFRILINPAGHFDEWLLERYKWDLKTGEELFCAIPKGIFVSYGLLNDLISWNWTNELIPDNVPTLFVTSTNDGIGSDRVSNEASKLLGSIAEVEFIQDAEHSFTNQPKLENRAIEIILKWLDEKR